MIRQEPTWWSWHVECSFGSQARAAWTVIAIDRVPRPILGVPVQYYQAPPTHWKQKQGPPPWAAAKGHAKKKEHDD